jgi:hypothetical protein
MSLETTKVLEMLHGKLVERMDYLTDWVGKGLASDYAEYKRVCGEIKGMTEACRSINEVYIETVEGDENE